MDTTGSDRPSANIMIVDDMPDTLNLLCGIIKEGGYKARPVPCGKFALRAAASSPPDLFLLDIGMPEMDGFELCSKLKADPALNDIPVIFISGMANVEDKLKGFAAGGVDYIVKPFQFEEVHARVATHLELRRQARELEENYSRLRELEALRDSLVHMLVHDLRSPLTVLISRLGILRKETAALLSPEQIDDIEQSLISVKQMAMMVNSVLDVSKLEAAQMTLVVEDCDVMALVREVVMTLGALAAGQTVSVKPDKGAILATLDRALIFRVIQNLVANAIKFTPIEGGRIGIEIDRVDEGIRFRISNNGPGVAPEDQERIFTKFGQVENLTTRTVPSSGLGLPFCKLAVEAHGGRIGIESDIGKETIFWFILPDRLESPST